MELIHVTGNTYMISVGYADIGLYILPDSVSGHSSDAGADTVWQSDNPAKQAVLIDSGSDSSPELISLLKDNGLAVRAVLHTHLHIDHKASDELLYDEFGCRLFASVNELRHIKAMGYEDIHPRMEAMPDEGQFDPLSGKEISADPLSYSPECFRIVPSPGHTTGHVCVITPDDVMHLGDAMMSISRLNYSRMPYHFDIDDAIESMKMIRDSEHAFYIASHAGIITREAIPEEANANLEKERFLAQILLDAVSEPVDLETAQLQFMKGAGIRKEKTLKLGWMHWSSRVRIESLLQRGLIEVRGNTIRATQLQK